jgi:hypothetical protein
MTPVNRSNGVPIRLILITLTALLAVALPATARAESCQNEQIRAEQGSERLPDCRAFELVTPEVKGDDSSIGGDFGNPYGFPDGDHVYYASLLPLPGALSGNLENVLSTRTASGWVNTALSPHAGKGEPLGLFSGTANNSLDETAFTSDFSAAFVNSGFDTDPLDQDHAVDVYRVNIPSGASSLAALPDAGPLIQSYNPAKWPENSGTYIAGVSNNGSHVLFQTTDHLPTAPGTPADTHEGFGDELYDRTGGHTYLVGVLPNGNVPSCGAVLGDHPTSSVGQSGYAYGAISPDGSNVVFMTGLAGCIESAPAVYLRENNQTTVQLVGQSYAGRTADGSKVFTEGGPFTVNSSGEEPNGVYEYDVTTGTTTTISPEGWFVASSADGSRVYYLSGSGLYLWDKGTSTLIPNAGGGFASAVRNRGNAQTQNNVAVATPDGLHLLFLDRADLTGYNNFGPTCGPNDGSAGVAEAGFCPEAYVYDATSGSVTCVSCNPTGAPPLGAANNIGSRSTNLMGVEVRNGMLPPYSEGEISPDGSRVFFETVDALVPQDTNGLSDVYEWEKGRIYLISSGQGSFGSTGSTFSGASSNGNDVFILTTDHLAPQDIENSTQIYDARVGGGFPYRPFTTGCDSGQCQGPQTPAPAFGAPASATFAGLGNPIPVVSTPAVKAKVKQKRQKRRSKKKRGKGSKAGKADGRAGKGNGKRKGRK